MSCLYFLQLLKTLPVLQAQLDALVEFDVSTIKSSFWAVHSSGDLLLTCVIVSCPIFMCTELCLMSVVRFQEWWVNHALSQRYKGVSDQYYLSIRTEIMGICHLSLFRY